MHSTSVSPGRKEPGKDTNSTPADREVIKAIKTVALLEKAVLSNGYIMFAILMQRLAQIQLFLFHSRALPYLDNFGRQTEFSRPYVLVVVIDHQWR